MKKSQRRWMFAILTTIQILCVTMCESSEMPSNISNLPHGEIHPLLHAQSLSHFAFHSVPIQRALASFFKPRTVTIVGVEWGTDVIHFAKSGYRVFAVEPATKFITHLQRLMKENPKWDITILPFAAANQTGWLSLEYDNERIVERVPTARLDDYVNEDLAVLSADIQGDEYSVLQGSVNLLQNRTASIWVEAIACNEQVLDVLNMLNKDYVIFDFVPWGKSLQHPPEDNVPKRHDSFVFSPDRPRRFREYFDWLCHQKTTGFRWLQTDILAVRRHLVRDVWSQLSRVASDNCDGVHTNCILRGLSTDEKEEL